LIEFLHAVVLIETKTGEREREKERAHTHTHRVSSFASPAFLLPSPFLSALLFLLTTSIRNTTKKKVDPALADNIQILWQKKKKKKC
jgi:hypothetical protein